MLKKSVELSALLILYLVFFIGLIFSLKVIIQKILINHKDCNIQIFSLQKNWDDAVSWDNTADSQRGWTNPSSNPFGELVIGDSRTYYKVPNIRTYFRFRVRISRDADVAVSKLLLQCSYGGKSQPKLEIRYVDLKELPSFENEPWNLPLSLVSVSWEKEENNWDWKTYGHYKTPDLKVLIDDWRRKYGRDGEFGIVIINGSGNKDNFKGICSFDDEPQRSAKLVIKYK